ncbi:MAG: TonB family protein [Pseudomonadota bacterium]
MIALGISLLLHAILLAVRIVAPDAFKLQPADPGLEVILVNAKHASRPLKADALAQADLDGGGHADSGRARSPLPDLRRMETGESVKATQRRIAELEQKQKNLLTRARKSDFNAAPVTEKDKPDPTRSGADLLETSRAIARQAAEITQRIEDENKRPHKKFLSPSTIGVGYAFYYQAMTRRIEEIGTLNFPQRDGRKLYGQVVLSIPIFMDGTVYQKEGGVQVERSSGNPALDTAAVAIVRRSAPFGQFPPNMLSADRNDLWILTITFKFARNDRMEAEPRGERN